MNAGNYTETNQKVLTLPEDVGGSALELLLQGIYLQEVGTVLPINIGIFAAPSRDSLCSIPVVSVLI